jgi:FkbM family methyltransferase
LIIDVGLFDGADSAYYLESGYRVVAVEADPLKVERCRKSFSREIAEQRLTILNIGISGSSGTLPFYRNLVNEGWSSFIPEYGKRDGRFEEIAVPCITLADVLQEHGVPYYLKIDIEGMDEAAVSTLTSDLAPDYLSTEVGCSQVIPRHLADLGYRYFKLINQEFKTSSQEIYDSDMGWRLLRKLGRAVPPLKHAIQALPHAWRSKTEWDNPYAWKGRTFGANSTGPFAEATQGPWLRYEEMERVHSRACQHAEKNNIPPWWDVHAKR